MTSCLPPNPAEMFLLESTAMFYFENEEWKWRALGFFGSKTVKLNEEWSAVYSGFNSSVIWTIKKRKNQIRYKVKLSNILRYFILRDLERPFDLEIYPRNNNKRCQSYFFSRILVFQWGFSLNYDIETVASTWHSWTKTCKKTWPILAFHWLP